MNEENSQSQKIAEKLGKIANDEVFQQLLKRSSLTRKQAETLIFDVMTQRDGVILTSQQRAALRKVSKGAYFRTRQQALRNISKSLFTLILLTYLGLLKLPGYDWFFRLSQAFEDGDWEAVNSFLASLEVEK
ncbi:MAG: hypothetical protein NZ570_06650 [Candidatus Caldarchaeum sp.]|nr:hypothetical protein [Candidatus Caldarchaeum sp.]MDW8358996.1 hypothetical protein [Candidatus Caldarchaeum sp.]